MIKSVSLLLALDATEELIATLPERTILISAVDRGWNDFSYKMRGVAHVIGEERLIVDHLLMFEGQENTYEFLSRQLEAGKAWPFQAFDRRFCSLFHEPDVYAHLARIFGLDATLDALSALGDATVLRDAPNDPRHELLSGEQFHLGIVREPNAYRAFRKGSRHLKATGRQQVEDAAVTFSVTSSLPPMWKETTVLFDFTPDQFVRERMAVLVGPNGTGKTSLLLAMSKAIAAGDQKPDPGDDLTAILNPVPKYNGLFVLSSAPSDRYGTVKQTAGGPDFESFLLIEPPSEMFDPLTLALVDVLRDDEPAFTEPQSGGTKSRKRLVEEILSELKLWKHVHLPVLNGKSTRLPKVQVGDEKYMPLSAFSGGEKRRLLATMSADISKRPVFHGAFGLRALSSGELAMFRFTVQLVSAIEPGCLVILDEPETHLHPKYIAQMMEILDRVVKATRSCAIIATHSPFVVREVPNRRVLVLSFVDGKTLALSPRLQTFGASIDEIAEVVFSDSQRSHLHEKLLDDWLAERIEGGLEIEQIIERHGAELHPKNLSYIARRLHEPKP